MYIVETHTDIGQYIHVQPYEIDVPDFASAVASVLHQVYPNGKPDNVTLVTKKVDDIVHLCIE